VASLLVCLLAAAGPPAPKVDYASRLAGRRLVLEGTTCAGLELHDGGQASLYAEMECSHGHEPTVEARIRWIARDTFVVVETADQPAGCPPRTWLYKIEAMTKDTVRLRDVWTGWGAKADSVATYRVQPGSTPAETDEVR
jgi:hypothetical protein